MEIAPQLHYLDIRPGTRFLGLAVGQNGPQCPSNEHLVNQRISSQRQPAIDCSEERKKNINLTWMVAACSCRECPSPLDLALKYFTHNTCKHAPADHASYSHAASRCNNCTHNNFLSLHAPSLHTQNIQPHTSRMRVSSQYCTCSWTIQGHLYRLCDCVGHKTFKGKGLLGPYSMLQAGKIICTFTAVGKRKPRSLRAKKPAQNPHKLYGNHIHSVSDVNDLTTRVGLTQSVNH